MRRHFSAFCPGRRWLLVHVPLALAAATTPGLADGVIVSPYGLPVWEPGQQALILIDEENGREELVLQVDFIGATKDFGWIVPTPGLPTLSEADPGIFSDCARLTYPLSRRRGDGWGCNEEEHWAYPAGREDSGVIIYDEQTVGIYQTMTLGAEDAEVLSDSLLAWGYLHDQNRTAITAALDFYIGKEWYFVAMRIDSAGVGGGYEDGYWYGPIEPIGLSFATDEPVYPLRISSISTEDRSQITLYVRAPHRMTFPGAHTTYANRITGPEYAYVQRTYSYLAPHLADGCFLTKLTVRLSADRMTEDLYLVRALSDDEFREIDYSSAVPTTGLLLLGTAGVFCARAIRRSRSVTRRR